MMSRSLRAKGTLLAAVLTVTALSLTPGCRRSVVTPEARPWPAVSEDPLETIVAPESWPMFRGPNAQGIAPRAKPPVVFSPENNLKWKVAIPGQGNSSPVVWENTIFLTTAVGDRRQAQGYLLALRRCDGTIRWQREVGTISGKTHPKNGFASASPATDGERVVAFFGSEGLVCYDFDGNLLWRKDLGPQEHMYGVACSPIIVGDMVVQLCDRESDSFLVALDKRTGQEMWRTPRPSTGSWTTPVLANEDGPSPWLLINGGEVGMSGRISAYDLKTGQEVWHRDALMPLVTPVALVRDHTLFSMCGRNGPILALRLNQKDATGGPALLWQVHRGGPYIPSGIVYRNRLYVVSDLRWLTCYNPGNGEVVWRGALEGDFTASLVAADGKIYAVNERGVVFVIEAGDQFQLLARNVIGGRCLATPALVGRDLILRSGEHLYLFRDTSRKQADQEDATPRPAEAPPDQAPPEKAPPMVGPSTSPPTPTTQADESSPAETGISVPLAIAESDWPVFRGTPSATGVARAQFAEAPRQEWIFTAENDSFTATPIVASNTVYLGSDHGTVFAVELFSGNERWKWKAPTGIVAPAGYHAGRVFVGDIDGGFHCLQAETGEPLWHFDAGGEIDGGPSFHTLASGRSVVVFGSQNANLYCLDVETGDVVWKLEGHDQIRCTPPVAEGHTFVAGCDGRLHVIVLEKGEEVGAVNLEGPTGSTPAILGEMAYVGTENGIFFAINWRQGTVSWQFEIADGGGGAFRSSAAVNERYVAVGSRDRRLHCLDRLTGQQLWDFPSRRYVDASPVIVRAAAPNEPVNPGDDVVITASLDGRLTALRMADGQVLWEMTVGGAISASPVVASGRLLVATEDGDLFCYISGEEK